MLFIHIGMPKTGSSYLQCLATKNREQLKRQGVTYPPGRNDELAFAGRISSGNGDALETLVIQNDVTHLISSELFFNDFHTISNYVLSAIGSGIPVRLIMLTRDVLPYLASAWQQDVKRSGMFEVDLDKYLEDNAREWLSTVLCWLNFSVANEVELCAPNYSRNKQHLEHVFFRKCVGIEDISSFNFVNESPVNRSLSRSELILQQVANRYFGKASSRYISDVLVNECSSVIADIIRPSHDVASHVQQFLQPLLDKVNRYLPHYQRILFDGEGVMHRGVELRANEPLTFSPLQIDALLSHATRTQ